MLPVELWYWDPKRVENLINHEQFIHIKEDNMFWERIIYTVALIVAEEALKHYITKTED